MALPARGRARGLTRITPVPAGRIFAPMARLLQLFLFACLPLIPALSRRWDLALRISANPSVEDDAEVNNDSVRLGRLACARTSISCSRPPTARRRLTATLTLASTAIVAGAGALEGGDAVAARFCTSSTSANGSALYVHPRKLRASAHQRTASSCGR